MNCDCLSLMLLCSTVLSIVLISHYFHVQSGLFFYDIFWVFFTPVMVSVAKSFDAPIKVGLLLSNLLYGNHSPSFYIFIC